MLLNLLLLKVIQLHLFALSHVFPQPFPWPGFLSHVKSVYFKHFYVSKVISHFLVDTSSLCNVFQIFLCFLCRPLVSEIMFLKTDFMVPAQAAYCFLMTLAAVKKSAAEKVLATLCL